MRYLITLVMGFVAFAARALTFERPRLPEIVKFRQNPFVKRLVMKVVAGGGRAGDTIIGIVRSVARAFTRFFDAMHVAMGGTLAGARSGHLALPATIKPRYESYVKLTTEAHALQQKYAKEPMPQNVGEEFEAKLQEAEAIWNGSDGEEGIGAHVEAAEAATKRGDALDAAKERRERFDRVSRTVPNPTMPAADPEDRKGIAGFVTLGDYIVASQAFRALADANFKAAAPISNIPAALLDPTHHGRGVRGRDGRAVPLVALDREGRKRFEEAMEAKSLVSVGSGVIEPERLDIVPQVTADDRLRLRDVIRTGQTTSNAVSYIREESFTRAAAETTAGSGKPEAALSYTEQTANVRDVPVWIPVTTAQLADWPQLRGLIDGRLLYDLEKRIEEQIMYGDGSAPNIEGLLDVSGTQNVTAHAKYVGANDELEHIRLAITMVMVAGYEANALLIHPLDWFDIVVAKGSDKHYLGQLFMANDRAPRVWSVNVVETIAAEQNAGNATEERNWIVGDFLRGCELVDRMQANVMVGLNSDDFTKNKRTILAETRLAFPIYAPAAFAYKETQALGT